MKRIYESPELQQIDLLSESLLITASPGVGGDYDPNDPIGAPRQEFFDEEETDEEFLSSTYKCNFLGADNKQ